MNTIPIPQVRFNAHSAPASTNHSPIDPYGSLQRVADALREEANQTSALTRTLEDQHRQSDSLIPGLINSLNNNRALNQSVVNHILRQRQRITELENQCADLALRLAKLEQHSAHAGSETAVLSRGPIPNNVERARREYGFETAASSPESAPAHLLRLQRDTRNGVPGADAVCDAV